MIHPDNIARAKALATEIKRVCNSHENDCENCPFHLPEPHVFCAVHGIPTSWNVDCIGNYCLDNLQKCSLQENK